MYVNLLNHVEQEIVIKTEPCVSQILSSLIKFLLYCKTSTTILMFNILYNFITFLKSKKKWIRLVLLVVTSPTHSGSDLRLVHAFTIFLSVATAINSKMLRPIAFFSIILSIY